MKILFILLVAVHGFLHLVGFMKGIRLKDFPQIKTPISGIQGVFWFFGHAILMTALALFYSAKPYWWIPGIAGAILSQLLIISIWRDAKWGTLINIFILCYALVDQGKMKFEENYAKQIESFYQSTRIPGEKGIAEEDIKNLPYPVQNWIRQSGVLSKDKIVTCRTLQSGEMKLDPEKEKWIKTRAEQYYRLNEPGFLWKAEMTYAGIFPLLAVDYWSDTRAEMNVDVLYLFKQNTGSGKKIDEGSMQRFLAEVVWFPSLACSSLMSWKAIDSLQAEGTINYKGKMAGGIFRFNQRGDFLEFSTMRFKDEGEKYPWIVKAKSHSTMNGIRIPIDLEVSWKLPKGEFTWYKLHVGRIEYNLPYRF